MTTRIIALLLAGAIPLTGCGASRDHRLAMSPQVDATVQQEAPAAADVEVWRRFAAALPPAAIVRVELKDGATIRGTLMAVEPEVMVIKPKTRLTEPPKRVPFASITSIEPERGNGIGVGKAVAIGVVSGAASFAALVLIAFTFAAD